MARNTRDRGEETTPEPIDAASWGEIAEVDPGETVDGDFNGAPELAGLEDTQRWEGSDVLDAMQGTEPDARRSATRSSSISSASGSSAASRAGAAAPSSPTRTFSGAGSSRSTRRSRRSSCGSRKSTPRCRRAAHERDYSPRRITSSTRGLRSASPPQTTAAT